MQKKIHNSTRPSISSRRRGKTQHRREVSAGGCVFKRTPRGLYFAMLKDSFGNWSFPKGHVRSGEAFSQAAAREINEELGIGKVKFIKSLGKIDIWFRDRFVFKGKLVHKFIYYFLFEVPSHTRLIKPQTKEKGERIQAVAWVPWNQVLKRSAYGDMKPIIRQALAYLKVKESAPRPTLVVKNKNFDANKPIS